MLAEANAAANGGAAAAAEEDGMEIEEEPEPEQIRIVRDYKRPDPKYACNPACTTTFIVLLTACVCAVWHIQSCRDWF